MPSLAFTDAIGAVTITTPAYSFANWTPGVDEIGDRATGLGTGAEFFFGFRTDYTVRFDVTHLPPLALGNVIRYTRHLLSGGQCTVFTDDAASRVYTCTLKPGTTPSWSLIDRTNLEYTLSVELRNAVAAPMLADYSAVSPPPLTMALVMASDGRWVIDEDPSATSEAAMMRDGADGFVVDPEAARGFQVAIVDGRPTIQEG